ESFARADALEEQIARNLEKRVSEVDDARAESVDGLTESEILDHLQFGEAEVVAIEPGCEEQERHEGNDPAGDLCVDRIEIGCRGDGLWRRTHFCRLRVSSTAPRGTKHRISNAARSSRPATT